MTTKLCIYAHGDADPNPGPGGWGAFVVAFDDQDAEIKRMLVSGGHSQTTNNRMHMTAVIEGLKSLKQPSTVTVYSPAQYVINAMTAGWSKAKNKDLWTEIDELCKVHTVTWEWLPLKTGHVFLVELEGAIAEQIEQYSQWG